MFTINLVKSHLLTDRQATILDGLVNGFTHKEIAKNVGISPKTVAGHIDRLREAFSIDRPAQIVPTAIADGVIEVRRRTE